MITKNKQTIINQLIHNYIKYSLGSIYFSRRHPLACWLSTIICIFSSTFLVNFLLNEPVISALGNTQQVIWVTLIWYLIFYSPFDIVFRICNFVPVKIILNCMNEIHNCKAIYQGIIHTAKIFPDSYFIMTFIGVVKGNGPGFTRFLGRLIRGSWSVNVMEFMHPSYTTKVSALTAIIFIVNKHSEWLMISQSFVFFCVVSASIYFRLSAILIDVSDPFSPFENLICLFLFGGIWDALAKAFTADTNHSRCSQPTTNLRAKALRADILSRNGQQAFVAKPLSVTPQMT